jgi:hypothetical protein
MSDAVDEPTPIWDRFPPRERMAINFTLTCNLSCAHCIVESGPHRTERLSVEEVTAALRAGAAQGKRHVTFSGGEVFLFPAQVTTLVAEARSLGYVVDIETNAFWARNPEVAARKLAPFVEAGVAGMALSADAFHTERFPVTRTIQAARTGREMGLLTEINFCPSTDRAADDAIVTALREAGEPFLRNELLDRGRGKDLVTIRVGHPVEDLPECDSLTTTVHATGDMYACCELDISTDAMKRTPVFLGSIRGVPDEDRMRRRERVVREFYDPASPIYFRRMVAEHPMFAAAAAGRYTTICDFCLNTLDDPAIVAELERLLDAAPPGTDPAPSAGATRAGVGAA